MQDTQAGAGRGAIHSLANHLSESLKLIDQHTSRPVVDAANPERFITAARRICRNSTLFTTDDGLIGLGHGHIQHGDQICILFGGRVPFVLREDGKKAHCKVIATAYIEGLMNGEKTEGRKREEFCLI